MVSNLRIEERIKIKALHDEGHGVSSIAKYLKRHKTSIYRELSKRDESGIYDYEYAQKLTSANMMRQGQKSPTDNKPYRNKNSKWAMESRADIRVA